MTNAGEELVAVPRSLLSAACVALRKKLHAPNILTELNRYAVHGPALAAPSAPASAPSPAGGVREAELVRAATALMNNLWQDIWSYDRTHEENWKEFDRKYPGMKWLRDARDAALSSPATPEPVSAPSPAGGVREAHARAIYEAMGFAYEGRGIGSRGPFGEWATALKAADAIAALSTPAEKGGRS